jgi:hypothetical protein
MTFTHSQGNSDLQTNLLVMIPFTESDRVQMSDDAGWFNVIFDPLKKARKNLKKLFLFITIGQPTKFNAPDRHSRSKEAGREVRKSLKKSTLDSHFSLRGEHIEDWDM